MECTFYRSRAINRCCLDIIIGHILYGHYHEKSDISGKLPLAHGYDTVYGNLGISQRAISPCPIALRNELSIPRSG